MKINYKCLPCLVNQIVRVADITNADNKEALFKNVFQYLGTLDFTQTNPEIIGSTFQLLKEHIKNEDPYFDIRNYYNDLFLSLSEEFEKKIDRSEHPFEEAIKYAIVGNIIDFSPIHNSDIDHIMTYFNNIDSYRLTVDHTKQLKRNIQSGKTLLYLGDNCGEICLDKLLLKKIKELNPNIDLYFAVRGTAIVNDNIEADAYRVGMDSCAKIISNGDNSLGTVLSRTGEEFNEIYRMADVVIAKGQANYESLNEQTEKNIYFLLMTKCDVIAEDIGVPQKSVLCLNRSYF